MKVKASTKPSVVLSHSYHAHYFSLKNVDDYEVKSLLKGIEDPCQNGSWHIDFYLGKIQNIYYETTDPWEAREEFANELAIEIAKFLK